jgi:hypothetical protein
MIQDLSTVESELPAMSTAYWKRSNKASRSSWSKTTGPSR